MEIRNRKLTIIKEWIDENNDIRAALITSSMVNPLAPIDDFSDLDIELVFNNTMYYLENKKWLYKFGEILNDYEEGIESFQGSYAMKMVQYKDGVKVDFKIYDVVQFRSEVQKKQLSEDWDIGYAILADKDNLTQGIQPPTHQVSIIKKPSIQEFEKIVNDFWWDVTYLPKCLVRKDLFYLKFMVERIIRVEYFVPVIEWYIGSKNNWKVTTNKLGRLFKKYLNDQEWLKLESTFGGSDIKENWIACENLLDEFDKMAQEIALKLGYEYNELKAREIKFFFHSHRNL